MVKINISYYQYQAEKGVRRMRTVTKFVLVCGATALLFVSQGAQAVSQHFIDEKNDVIQALSFATTLAECEALAGRWNRAVRTDLMPDFVENRIKSATANKNMIASYNEDGFTGPEIGTFVAAESQFAHIAEAEFDAAVAATATMIDSWCAMNHASESESSSYYEARAANKESDRADARRDAAKDEANYERQRLVTALAKLNAARDAATRACIRLIQSRVGRQAPSP